ncbi:MAG: hypothetical protein IIB59_01690 [Planctomycetes bacterium]|nr:hypothetical protein [Planctomycetota bacterium]
MRRSAWVCLFTVPLVVVCLWLVFQHKPQWYKPVRLDEPGLQRVRRDVASLVDDVGDNMVHGQSFEVTITDRELTEWLTALPDNWPQVRQAWPAELTEPVIAFRNGSIWAGVHFESHGWRVILNVEVTLAVQEDSRYVVVRLRGMSGGSLPLPRWQLERALAPYLEGSGSPRARSLSEGTHTVSSFRDLRSVHQLFEGVRVRNRFVWPNGERPFRLEAIDVADGTIRLQIAPL